MFSEGMMHGRGIYTWADGVTYEVGVKLNDKTMIQTDKAWDRMDFLVATFNMFCKLQMFHLVF